MRVYDKGTHVPMGDVTWELLCKSSTIVDFNLDRDVGWPHELGRIAQAKGLNNDRVRVLLENKKFFETIGVVACVIGMTVLILII